MAEWFKEWFETDDYLELYKHRDDTEAELLLKLILNNIKLNKNASVLDIACGAGRHSLLFAQNDFNVFAFDISKNLLRIAKEKSVEQNLSINFICTDVRYLALKKKFDLVLNLFTSFGYFEKDEENFSLFKDAHKFLNNDGSFVLDYFNSGYLRKNLKSHTINTIDGKEVIQQRFFDGDRVRKNITIKGKNDIKNYYESVRLFDQDELIFQLENQGFIIKEIFGNYCGDSFNKFSSPRLIIFMTK